MANSKKRSKRKYTKQVVGFISRIDYLNSGARKGLLNAAAETFKQEEVDFVVLAGGLVSGPDFRELLKEKTKRAVKRQKKIKRKEMEDEVPKEERTPVEKQESIRKREYAEFISEIAADLAEFIPVFEGRGGKVAKLYIVTSPATNYDREIGAEVAEELQQLREDIIFWDEESGRFELQGLDKDFWVVLPSKAAWRSKYYSTRVDRLVEDKQRQTAQDLPDLWVSDCAAVSLTRPAGENPRPQVSLPALHKLQDTSAAENQVGVRVVEFLRDEDAPLVRTYNFKDLTSYERSFVSDPDEANDRQLAILHEIDKRPSTIGMLEDELPWKRSTIEREIKNYMEAGIEPHIEKENSGKYIIRNKWIQEKLKYPLPAQSTIKEDRILGFGCLHAGYTNTQYRFFVEEVPRLILEQDINVLIGAGDFIAGLKHNMHLRGEVYAGMNYTRQEALAAELVGGVIMKVFNKRFSDAYNKLEGKDLSDKDVDRLIDDSLITYYYIAGNHDMWVKDHGMEPLDKFTSDLMTYLTEGVSKHINKYKLVSANVRDIVSKNTVYIKNDEDAVLPSGLTLSVVHLHQGRMQTTSGRAQQTLAARDSQVIVLANFHVGIEVLSWAKESGQRLVLQVGTLVSHTEFEMNMNKVVDTGVGVTKVTSTNGRIFMNETAFYGPRKENMVSLSNEDVIKELSNELGVAQ